MDRSLAAVLYPWLPPGDGATAPHDAISAVFTGDTVLGDGDRARWVLSWLSATEPTHAPLFRALIDGHAGDEALARDLRASIELSLYGLREARLSPDAERTLREHVTRLGVDDTSWREQMLANFSREQAA
jgi:hypothetical protein